MVEVKNVLYSIQQSIGFFLPEITITFAILLHTILSFFKKRHTVAPGVAIFITIVILILTLSQNDHQASLFSNWLSLSNFVVFFKTLVDISALLCFLLVLIRNHRDGFADEFCILILSITLGCHLLVMSNNLLMAFISIEMISLSSYMLAGFSNEKKSSEGSLKYFLFGCVASAVMLYGLTIFYGFSGSLDFTSDVFKSGLGNSSDALTTIAITFLLTGILFKLSAAPMHIWAPDVYEAAPTPFIAFLSVAPKLAAIAFLSKVALHFHQVAGIRFDWQLVLSGVIITTITVGNFAALFQKNFKRLMAYSSIAQSGFLLVGLTALVPSGIQFMLFYSAIFLVMNFLVFLYVIYFEKQGLHTIESFAGIGKHQVLACVFLLIGFLSLTGLPPTAGFTGKLFIFSSVWESFQISGKNILLWLLIFGLINTVVSLFYYFKIPYYSFLKTPETVEKQNFLTAENLLGAILVLLLLVLFLAPALLMGWINKVNFVF